MDGNVQQRSGPSDSMCRTARGRRAAVSSARARAALRHPQEERGQNQRAPHRKGSAESSAACSVAPPHQHRAAHRRSHRRCSTAGRSSRSPLDGRHGDKLCPGGRSKQADEPARARWLVKISALAPEAEPCSVVKAD